MTNATARAAHTYVGAFVEELSRSGIRHVCIAPGSRSTPLALTIAGHPRIRTWMHLDERSASFFALGMARALGEPVALLCTSGTAAANFLPAVIESRSACVPLLVLTADRPPELRDVGAAQTIDQNRLYGSYPKWFVDVALADSRTELLRYVRTLACRSVAAARATPQGPVHLNFPFREPLVPEHADAPPDMSASEALAWHGRPDRQPWVVVDDAPAGASAATVRRVAATLVGAKRPIIVCGPQFDPLLAAPLCQLATMIGAPLLADPLSQVRWGPHVRDAIIDRYDAALRDDSAARELSPDVILRFGAIPTSKTLLQFMERQTGASQIVVAAADWPDPTLCATEIVHADPANLCERMLTQIPAAHAAAHTAWIARWRSVDDTAATALVEHSAGVGEPFEGAALAAVVAALPAEATMFVSSSMPVRDLDSFAAGDRRDIRVLANRGANGIDGVVSTALGAAAARKPGDAPLVLVIGDIAFYHDMNGLLAARLHAIDATIIVINNDGGGIFSFLPQASHPSHFEQLFGTPHGLEFEPAARVYGARYQRAPDVASLTRIVSESIAKSGLDIVELRTDRARNVVLHREAWAHVGRAMKAATDSEAVSL